MTDLITEARELIEALHAGEYDDEYIGTGAYLMLDELCDALEKANAEIDRLSQLAMMRDSEIGDKDREIERLREAQRWVSVEERLPTVSEYRNGDKFKSMDSNELVPFLVCCEDTEIPFRAFYDGKNWGDGWGKQNVTHWQPLPQPPQKG
jgi:hypothetical protein